MKHARILVIDDDTAFLRLVEQIFTREGYEVLKANSGGRDYDFYLPISQI
jgi:DNA-binding response OmpR family regulator